MTPSDALRELEALCAAATPLPWNPHINYLIGGWNITAGASCEDGRSILDMGSEQDMKFAAAARSALPLLLAFLRGEDERHICVNHDWGEDEGGVMSYCHYCNVNWPCPTRLALNETLSKIAEGRG